MLKHVPLYRYSQKVTLRGKNKLKINKKAPIMRAQPCWEVLKEVKGNPTNKKPLLRVAFS